MIAEQESDNSISFNSSTNDKTLITFHKTNEDADAIMVNLNETIKDVVGLIKVNLDEPIKETGLKSESGFGTNLFKENPNLRRNNFSRSLAAGNYMRKII